MPVSLTGYFETLCSFLDAPQFAAMPQEDTNFNFMDERYSGGLHTAPGMWEKHFLMLDQNQCQCFELDELQLNMTSVCCSKKNGYVAYLSALLVLLMGVRSSNGADFSTVLQNPFHVLLFILNLSC